VLAGDSGSYSSSYRAGEDVGTVVVVVAAGWLFLWGLRRVRSSGQEQALANVTPKQRRARLAVITVLVLFVGGGLLSAVLGSGSQASTTSWSSQQGAQTRAGFVAGCKGSGGTTTDCTCLFSRLISYQRYSTPAGFATLNAAAELYKQTGNRADIPAVYVQSAQSCLASTS
jgi:hypothetical protein